MSNNLFETKSLTSRIRALVFLWGKDPIEINAGLCANFATVLWEQDRSLKIISDKDLGADEYSHTFIEFNNKYYDAETPHGISDWKMFPIYSRKQVELEEREIMSDDNRREFYLKCMNQVTFSERLAKQDVQSIRDGLILFHHVYKVCVGST